MSEPSKREQAANKARLALIRTFHTIEDTLDAAEDIRDIIGLVIDAAKEELREELAHRITPLRPEPKSLADAAWDRNEAAYRYLARDGKDGHRESAVEANAAGGGPPMAPCHQCSTPCPCPGNWFTCGHCGLHQSKPESRRKASAEPEDPGYCPTCKSPFELIRPGKSQPTCECWGRDI